MASFFFLLTELEEENPLNDLYNLTTTDKGRLWLLPSMQLSLPIRHTKMRTENYIETA